MSRIMLNSNESTKSKCKYADSFDVNLFNKIYDENKIQEVFDDGYGDWINQNQIGDRKQQKMFQDGFNKDLFNSTFESYKKVAKNMELKWLNMRTS